MASMRSNGDRIKRFRELKATLRTQRDRLLVGIDIAKAQHVAQLRVAHGQIVVPKVGIPNTTAGFAAFWRQVQTAQRTTGCAEIVCAVEPTGTYHEALGRFLEQHGVDVVLVANQVAHIRDVASFISLCVSSPAPGVGPSRCAQHGHAGRP